MQLKIPYGEGALRLDVPDRRVKAVLCQNAEGAGSPDEAEIVRGALAEPIGSPALRELAAGKHSVTILTSDHTRPMPSALTLPLLLEEVRRGAPAAEITILVATGLHRATTDEELLARFGKAIFRNEKIVVHNCRDASVLRPAGILPSGGALMLSKYALDADLLIAEGFIEPHFFAGFSGGRKSVMPGVAGYDCVTANHCSAFIANRHAAAGVLEENPVHIDMAYAAEKAGLAFILNVMLGPERKVTDAVAGEPTLAHAEGCRRVMERVAMKRETAPIVIASNGGYPLDQNLYQLVKCMDTAEKCCGEGGVIIAAGECRDGTGGEAFHDDFAGGESPAALTSRFLARSPAETETDQWQSQILARILEKRSVIVVAPLIEEAVKEMGLGFAASLEDALFMADAMIGNPKGEEAEIVVIPDGPGIVIV
ncbi:MAG: nickel-dependent lactate racemase [Clostridiales bacterium]|nr:nickel-dependent lactate racemase [Clostridiales bacterium]